MGSNKKSARKRSTYQAGLILFTLVCVITGFFCFQYYYSLQRTIREESNGYLKEISTRIGININRMIVNNYSALNSLAAEMVKDDIHTFQDVKEQVELQKKFWNYKDILLVDKNGDAYNENGEKVALDSTVFLQDAVLSKSQSMSTSQMINGKEYVMFAVPAEGLEVEGIEMSTVAASYETSTFEGILSMTSFDEMAYTEIIRKDGTRVIRSSSSSAQSMGYNVLSTIEKAEMDKGCSMDAMRKDIAADKSGQIGFTMNDERSYVVYLPIQPEDWYLLTIVPVSVVNAKSDMLLKITLVLCALVTLVFACLLLFLGITFYRNKRRLEHMVYVDEITGGNTIQRFYALSEEILQDAGSQQYALVYTNIAKFKVLNDQLGRDTCDNMLKVFYEKISEELGAKECIGRISGDNFCILLKYEGEEHLLERFRKWYENVESLVRQEEYIWALPITEFGIFVIDDKNLLFTQMTDRAKLAIREFSRPVNAKMRYAIYDDTVRRSLFREKHLEDMMETALKNDEFKIFLQPKYKVTDETIGGAEALTRWISASEGMIYPDEFIPIFEKNGFIVQLDLWVFEGVCKKLREWLDAGLNPIKISVNCSRVHFKNADFLRDYKRLIEKYKIPFGLIEIELTESIVMEDSQNLIKIIENMHKIGLCCSMDDFGSGYSSLNLIQTIPVDTLKLDKIFFREKDKDPKRLEAVVGSIVGISKALDMETVAEGVEYKNQVDMLRKIGCDYIQGYVFAKPMPMSEFERLAFDKN